MLKFALCISGHLRSFSNLKDNYNSFLKFLKTKANVDVFLCTWDYLNANTGYHLEQLDPSLPINHIHSIQTPSSHLLKKHFKATEVKIYNQDFYSSVFSPLKWTLLSSKDLSGSASAQQNHIFHFCKMLFLIYECNLIKLKAEHSLQKKYDVVLRIRPDYRFDTFWINQLNLLRVQPQTLYSASIHGEIDDQFIYGDSFSMDFFSNSLNRLCELFNNQISFNNEHVIAESIKLYSNIKFHTIPIIGQIERNI